MTYICVARGNAHCQDAVIAYDRFVARREDYGGPRRIPRPLASSLAWVGRGESLRGRFLRDPA